MPGTTAEKNDLILYTVQWNSLRLTAKSGCWNEPTFHRMTVSFVRVLKSPGTEHVQCSCKDPSQYRLFGRPNSLCPIGSRPCTNSGLILLFIPDILGADWCQDTMLERKRKIERESLSEAQDLMLEKETERQIFACWDTDWFNPLNPELNPICYFLALLAHHFLHVSRIMVKSLTLRLLMTYIYIWSAYSWCF